MSRKEKHDQSIECASRKTRSTLELWKSFANASERFERQRLSCDAGLAFAFAEGALVDAIESGKW
jgi:midasin (ATPase involved in ribosome maturation)